MNKNKLVLVVISVIILATVYIFVIPKSKVQKPVSSTENTPVCIAQGKTIEVEVNAKGLSPTDVKANLCDRLVFKNTDTKIHEPAFGTHDLHWPYPGYNEDILFGGKSVDFLLTEKGDFELHDHINPNATGKISISG